MPAAPRLYLDGRGRVRLRQGSVRITEQVELDPLWAAHQVVDQRGGDWWGHASFHIQMRFGRNRLAIGCDRILYFRTQYSRRAAMMVVNSRQWAANIGRFLEPRN